MSSRCTLRSTESATGSLVKIAVIGTGKMARGFAAALAPKHEVTLGSRDADRASQAASSTGASRGATYADAAADAKAVILTVPWHAIGETLTQLEDLNGTVVVDVSYPVQEERAGGFEGVLDR
jgi:hypothetical protein